MRRLPWSAFAIVLLAFPASVSASPAAERSVTIDPPAPVPGGDMVITVTGWPDTCVEVELAYLDGSVGGRDEGEVLGSWGSLQLVDGAGTTTVTAPGPEEYNLRVSGPADTCGEPYYSPDFFVETPRPPQPNGRITPRWLDDDGRHIGRPIGDDPPAPAWLEVLAEGWTDACPSLDVVVHGGTDSTSLGVVLLEGGSGSISAPAAVLVDNEPSLDAMWWDVVATGPVDRCGGSYITELSIPGAWPPTAASTTTTIHSETTSPSAGEAPTAPPAASVDGGLPSTGAATQAAIVIAIVVTLVGGVLLAASRRRPT